MHLALAMALSLVMRDGRVRPGKSKGTTRRSSGAQPRKRKPEGFRSVKRAGGLVLLGSGETVEVVDWEEAMGEVLLATGVVEDTGLLPDGRTTRTTLMHSRSTSMRSLLGG